MNIERKASVTPPVSSQESAEAGFMLVGVIVMIALVLIALSVAAPVIAKQLRRDKEVESEHRAEQYVRAIRLYYRKTGAYPPSIDALKNTSDIRFLRQEYVDPLTGKSDWRIIHLGEQKTTVKVFFGQELGNLPGSGTGGSGLGSAAGMSSGVGTPVGAGTSTTSTIGATSALASGFSGASITSGTSGPSGSTGSSGAFGSTGSSGSTGGGAIVGVGTAKTGTSILTPDKQTTYETWEFWYDPRIEQLYQKGRMNAGIGSGSLSSQPASSFGATGASGSTGGFGSSSFGSSSPGNSSPGTSGFGSTGATTGAGTPTTTTPVTPQ